MAATDGLKRSGEIKVRSAGDFPRGAVVKNLPANAGDTGSIPHAAEQLSPGTTTTEPVL